jgi:multiple sugar transport system permease protein
LVDWLHILSEKPVWLIGPNTIWAIIIPTIWRQWPFAMLMLLAGLQNISKDVYEAAHIDGASPWQSFRHITWPLLKPVWAILILHGLIFNVYSFNIVIMMFGNGAGFPGKNGDLLMTNIFRNSFQMWDFGSGAAMSSLLMLGMVTVVFVWYRIFKDSLSAR